MSMPNRVRMFPRGYSGGQSTTIVEDDVRSGDPEVVALFDEYCKPANAGATWGFRKRVLKAAKRLFSGDINWFIRQDTNRKVRDYNYEFLLDTIRFIATGQRRISVLSWGDLIQNHPEDTYLSVRERHGIADAFRDYALKTNAAEMIQRWCSWPGGVDDMVFSLHWLFGEIRIKPDA